MGRETSLESSPPREAAPLAVLLLNMGGPDSEDAIRPFLVNLFSDPAILPLSLPLFLRRPLGRFIAARRAERVKPRYRALGGKSPQIEFTARQAKALEALLNYGDGSWRVFYAMRYWHPRVSDVFRQILAVRPQQLMAIPLYPQYSRAVTGSSLEELRGIVQSLNPPFPVHYRQEFHLHHLYLEALGERIASSLKSFPAGGREASLLFSAHNLPEKLIRSGDPYLDQVRATVNALLPAIAGRPWRLAFQSRTGPVRWLKPEVLDALRELRAEGRSQVLLVPISFVSDQIETLYEIDELYRAEADRLGIKHFRRTPAFNDSPDFIALLAALAREES